MQVEPQGQIYICHDVPLDPTYQHTIWWSGAGEQLSYFMGLAKHNLSKYSYMRQDRVIKVELPADKLYDCNYLCFKNTGFTSARWFFWFITEVEYINTSTTALHCEVDVMQTWYFDYELGSCFVEREHAAFDEIGDNLVPENVELGEYVLGAGGRPSLVQDGLGIPLLLNQSYVLATTTDGVTPNVTAGFYAGYPTSCRYIVFPAGGEGKAPTEFQTMLNQIVENGKEAGIVAIFMCPTEFTTGNGGQPVKKTFSFSKKQTDSIYGFEVKNKKLFTYPFNMLYCNNMQGQTATFLYEYFTGDSCTFTMTANMNPNGEAIIWPNNYKGQSENVDERLSIQINPEIPFAVDSYKSWVAQKGMSFMLSAIGSAATGLVGLAGAGNAVSGASQGAGLFFNIAASMAAWREAYIQPPQSHGSITGDSLQTAGLKDFFFYNKHITPDMAKRIDSYFTMFGYATKKVKIPNRHARFSFTFTKTVGCVAKGSVPAEDMAKICSVYDRGVTFWSNKTDIGNYEVTNTPVGTEGA